MRFASARVLTALFGYLDSLGVAPRTVADAASIAFARSAAGSERIPATLAIRILERCSVRLDDPLFGLKYAQALDPGTFGPISLFWRYAPTLRHNHRFSARILHMHHEGVMVDLIAEEHEAAFVYRMDAELRHDARQFVESNLSFALRICRWILGRDWSPLRVAFAHEPAAPPDRYAAILNAPVVFGAAEDALVVDPSDLDRKSAGHDPALLDFVERSLLAAAGQEPRSFREHLERTLDHLLALRAPRLGAAAAVMGLSGRNLQRRLAAEGVTFQEVLAGKRRQIVEDALLRRRRPSLSVLAERTGYSDATALSRFLRSQSLRGHGEDISL